MAIYVRQVLTTALIQWVAPEPIRKETHMAAKKKKGGKKAAKKSGKKARRKTAAKKAGKKAGKRKKKSRRKKAVEPPMV